MNDKKKESPEGENIVIGTLIVVVLTLTSALLLLVALVTWFAQVIGSECLSLLIIGSALGISAWTYYKISLSPPLRRLREEYTQFMTIVRFSKQIADSIINRIIKFLKANA